MMSREALKGRMMSNEAGEKQEEKKGFFGALFNSISIKTKLIFGVIASVFGFIAFHMFQKRYNDKEILKLELDKVRQEIEIEKAQEKIVENNQKLDALQVRADEIVKEIATIEKPDPDREVSDQELDKFFDDREF
jgi:hypothetical protein